MNIKPRLFFVTFFTLLTVNHAYAAPVSPATQLTQRLQAFQTFTAEFEQMVLDQNGKEIQKSQGQVAIQKPGLFRWEVKTPFQQILVANDQILWVYDVGLEQATRHLVNNAVSKTPALFLTGRVKELLKTFAVTRETPSANLDWFGITPLQPKTQENIFTQVLLGFEGSMLKAMIIKDELDQSSHILFKNIERNIPISEQLFLFTPPEGIDIIDHTK